MCDLAHESNMARHIRSKHAQVCFRTCPYLIGKVHTQLLTEMSNKNISAKVFSIGRWESVVEGGRIRW